MTMTITSMVLGKVVEYVGLYNLIYFIDNVSFQTYMIDIWDH